MLTTEISPNQIKIDKARKRVERWLLTNKDFINMTGIEKEIGAPKGLIQKFIKYNVKIKDHWICTIHQKLEEISYL